MAAEMMEIRQQSNIQRIEPRAAMQIAEVIERRNLLVKFVKEAMVEGVDYGKIPGTDKATLLKPGAEKLNTLFHFTPRPQIIEKVEDWTGRDHGGEMFFYYLYRFQLWNGDFLVAEADGSCNSFEKKYRWRKADRVCPVCQVAAIRKDNNRGGWYCWKKIDGCGVQFKANDPEIISQEAGRVPNPDMADIVNTILKMASKRALVAATLIAINASEFFTQDLEDQVIESHYSEDNQLHEQAQDRPQAPQRSEQKQDSILDDIERLRIAAGKTPAMVTMWLKDNYKVFGLNAAKDNQLEHVREWLSSLIQDATADNEPAPVSPVAEKILTESPQAPLSTPVARVIERSAIDGAKTQTARDQSIRFLAKIAEIRKEEVRDMDYLDSLSPNEIVAEAARIREEFQALMISRIIDSAASLEEQAPDPNALATLPINKLYDTYQKFSNRVRDKFNPQGKKK
jgi:hypothetical protein